MKYIKIYESFDSSYISNIVKFLGRKFKSNSVGLFTIDLRRLMKWYGINLNGIEDEDLDYLNRNKAIKISRGDISNKYGIYCIKFWFSLSDGYIGMTCIAEKDMEFIINEEGRFSQYEINFINRIVNKGELFKVDKKAKEYRNLKTGDKVIAFLDDTLVLGTIFTQGDIYIIQNEKNGSSPGGNEWKKYGQYSWIIMEMNDSICNDHSKLHIYILNDKDINNYNKKNFETDVPIKNGIPSEWKKEDEYLYVGIKKSDFCLVLYLDKLLKKNINNE